MKRTLFFMALFSVSVFTLAQNEFTGDGDGYSWEDPNNWSEFSIPQTGDDILIDGQNVFRQDGNFETYGSLELRNYAYLFNQSDIWLYGDLIVDASSSIDLTINDINLFSRIICFGNYYFNGTMGIYLSGFAPQIGDEFQLIDGNNGSCGTQTVVYVTENQTSGIEVTFGVECESYGINYTVTDVNYTSAKSWDGEGGDNSWNNAANWDPNGVPVPDDIVYINLPTGGYVNTGSAGTTIVKQIIIGRSNTMAINGNLSVDDLIYNNTGATVIWNAGKLSKSLEDTQSILICEGNLILDSPGLKELEKGFEIWVFDTDVEHNQGDLNINNGEVRIYNHVNYNINGDNINIGYTEGTKHSFINRGKAIKKTTGSGTSSINLTNLKNERSIISESGTLVIGESLIESPYSNIGGNGTIQLPSGFVLGSNISPGSSPGILTIAEDLNTSSSAVLNVEINGPTVGTDYDKLVIENNANINANLNVILGYMPPNDAIFNILSAGSLTTSNLPENMQVDFNGNSMLFQVEVANNSIYLLGPGATLSNPNLETAAVKIYPNPIKDVLYVNLMESNHANWILFNSLGQVVLEGNIESTQANINTNTLKSGLYVLQLKDANNNILKVTKVLKE